MSATRTLLNASYVEFKTWCNNNLVGTYFDNITEDTTTNTLTFYVSQNEYIMTMTFSTYNGEDGVTNVDVYLPSTTTAELPAVPSSMNIFNASATNCARPRFGSICSNGAILRFTTSSDTLYSNDFTTRGIAMLITKNNNSETVIVVGQVMSTSTSYKNAFSTFRVLSTEADTFNTQSFDTFITEQVELVPFIVSKSSNQVVYTPNAYYMPTGNIYDVAYCIFQMNGVNYMSNGYWAVKDS